MSLREKAVNLRIRPSFRLRQEIIYCCALSDDISMCQSRLRLRQTHSTDNIDDSFNWAKRFFLLCFRKLAYMKRMQAKRLSWCDGLVMSPLTPQLQLSLLLLMLRVALWGSSLCHNQSTHLGYERRSKTVCSKLPLPDTHLNMIWIFLTWEHLNIYMFKCRCMLCNV